MCVRAIPVLCLAQGLPQSAPEQALERLVDGAAAADVAADMAPANGGRPGGDSAPGGGDGGEHVEQLLQRLLLPRVKAALGEPNLAVRQVRFDTRSHERDTPLHNMLLQQIATVAPSKLSTHWMSCTLLSVSNCLRLLLHVSCIAVANIAAALTELRHTSPWL